MKELMLIIKALEAVFGLSCVHYPLWIHFPPQDDDRKSLTRYSPQSGTSWPSKLKEINLRSLYTAQSWILYYSMKGGGRKQERKRERREGKRKEKKFILLLKKKSLNLDVYINFIHLSPELEAILMSFILINVPHYTTEDYSAMKETANP